MKAAGTQHLIERTYRESGTFQWVRETLKKDGIYGASMFREAGYGNFMFQERFRNEGGKFFDPATMKATINTPAGVKVLTEWRNENRFMPPGVEKFGFVENLAVFLEGKSAMPADRFILCPEPRLTPTS